MQGQEQRVDTLTFDSRYTELARTWLATVFATADILPAANKLVEQLKPNMLVSVLVMPFFVLTFEALSM